MPIRFTSPSLGGLGDQSAPKGGMRVTLSYRRLTADQFVIGHKILNASGPGGRPLDIKTNSFDLNFAYAMSSRLSLAINVPYMYGTLGRIYPDAKWHESATSGLGDMNATATYWILDPFRSPRGNLALTLGVKAGTGRHDVRTDFYLANGKSVSFPNDDTMQPGDGTWGVIVQLQGYQRLLPRIAAYASGAYTINPKDNRSEVRQPTGALATEHFAVPDVFGFRGGLAGTVSEAHRVLFSLGGRLDGTARSDLVDHNESGFRRPAVVGYVEPGLTITRGAHALALSVPIRAWMNFRPAYVDIAKGRRGGGDLANHLLLASYTVTF